MAKNPHIKGGYVLKPHCERESEIAHALPYIREIWNWLIMEANHSDKKSNGRIIKRGQCVRSYKNIQEGLSWNAGFCVGKYKKWQCENAMKWLKKRQMITTEQTTRGFIITICNYNFYQTPNHYDCHTGNHNNATTEPQPTDTINKNLNNFKELNNSNYENLF